MAQRQRPLSPNGNAARNALRGYGYICEPSGSWAPIPHGAMWPERTRDALERRGIGHKGVVLLHTVATIHNNEPPIEWPALLADEGAVIELRAVTSTEQLPEDDALYQFLLEAEKCKYGNSNDDEIQALNEALDEALARLGVKRPELTDAEIEEAMERD